MDLSFGAGSDVPLLRRNCRYLLSEMVTMATANAMTPEVSVRKCGM